MTRTSEGDAVAVVGLAALFPGARDLAAFRDNLRRGVDAISEVPPSRWDRVYFEPASSRIDRIYCSRGGFVDEQASFDALAFGIVPSAVPGTEPDQLLALSVATAALRDAGYDPLGADSRLPRERTAVILGRGGYLTSGVARLEQHVRVTEQVITSLRTLLPSVNEGELERVRAELQEAIGPIGPDALVGLVPNLAASRIANRLDLRGAAYTVDAACASSLVAVDHAVRELATGRSDLVLAGGVHLCQEATFWAGFCRLGAVSHRQAIRPFDRRADGLLLGEGIGILALRRLADAERDDQRIYAVIRGVGVSSDGRSSSLLAPSIEGQVSAVRAAWSAARRDPASVGLVEAHGTATPTGDAAELETLRRVFGGRETARATPGLGSVKSMIGHAMPAAGAAGLIKAILAVYGGELLPTLHAEEPHPGVADAGFRLIASTEPWEGNTPRRAGVSAFGFGGINAHVVVEQHASSPRKAPARTLVSATAPSEPTIFALAARDTASLLARLESGARDLGEGPARLGLVEPTAERLARLRAIVQRGEPWSGRHGMFFSPAGLLAQGGSVAFLFPGVDASFEPRVDDLAQRFGLPAPDLGASGAHALERTGFGIIGVNRLIDGVLRRVGILPDAVAGHSIGEWSAMVCAGVLPESELDRFVAQLAPGTLEVPGVLFAAVAAGRDVVAPCLEGLAEIAISHDNCPHQTILCGIEPSLDAALERLARLPVLAQKLPFRSGFHSPLFAPFIAPHRARLGGLRFEPPVSPLWSATTVSPYPADPDEVRALVLRHLVEPVRFRELVLALHAQGARVFVQAGTGSLTGFVGDTLRGAPHLAIAANVRERSGIAQLHRLALALFVEGHAGVAPWLQEELRAAWASAPVRAAQRPSQPLRLALGAPLVRLTRPLAIGSLPPPSRPPPSTRVPRPLAAAFDAALDEVTSAKLAVMDALSAPRSSRPGRVSTPSAAPPPSAPSGRRVLRLGVEVFPELRDHAFYPQPPGWPQLEDRYPVVPLTMLIALFVELAERAHPGRVVVRVEELFAFRWMAVEPPIDVPFSLRTLADGRVGVEAEGYASATLTLAVSYPTPPRWEPEALVAERPAAVSADVLYRDGWMFHGPGYQGVSALGPLGDNGIDGELRALAARGGLLDNAGQLFGYWVMERTAIDRLAMPVRVASLELFGPSPTPPARATCHVRVRRFGPEDVSADMFVALAGQLYCRITGWEDRRFDTDERSFALLRAPDRHLLSDLSPEGVATLVLPFRSVPQAERLLRRYLGADERREHAEVPLKQRYSWLLGRVALKDAARAALWRQGEGGIFPVEVRIEQDGEGVALAGRFRGRLQLAVEVRGDTAIAIAGEGPVSLPR
jgi:acyl transferase domain-containing protein